MLAKVASYEICKSIGLTQLGWGFFAEGVNWVVALTVDG